MTTVISSEQVVLFLYYNPLLSHSIVFQVLIFLFALVNCGSSILSMGYNLNYLMLELNVRFA